MNKPHKSFTVDEGKIQASLLQKSLYSHDFMISQIAAKRFQRLTEFKDLLLSEIIKSDIKRKHALAVIATEKGFKSWSDLKCQLPFIHGGFLNHWFAKYVDAKSFQQLNGGFILPYKNQFFICDANYINHLRLNAEDPDWKLINHDWINPTNMNAWNRLYKKWMKIQRTSNEKK